jgi:hypothetical protein
VSVNDKLAVLGLDVTLESAVGRIVLEHVDHVLEVDEGVAIDMKSIGKKNVERKIRGKGKPRTNLIATTLASPCSMALRRTIRPIRPVDTSRVSSLP